MRQGFAEDPSEERVVAGGQVGNLLHVTHHCSDHRMREWTPRLDVVGHVAVQCEFGVLGGVPGPPGLAEIVVPHLKPRSEGHRVTVRELDGQDDPNKKADVLDCEERIATPVSYTHLRAHETVL